MLMVLYSTVQDLYHLLLDPGNKNSPYRNLQPSHSTRITDTEFQVTDYRINGLLYSRNYCNLEYTLSTIKPLEEL